MFPETLKDLKWMLIKDLPFYNKPLPTRKRSIWDIVAFDVETTDGLYTFVFTHCEGLLMIANDPEGQNYISVGECLSMEKIENIKLPFDMKEHCLSLIEGVGSSENWFMKEALPSRF